MKTRSLFFSLLFATAAFGFLANCNGNQKDNTATSPEDQSQNEPETAPDETAAMEAASPRFEVDQTFQKQLAQVFAAYVSLKDAFVASDMEKIKKEASATEGALSKVDMKLVSGAAHHDWMNYQAPIENALKKIASANDIEVQRESFSTLSDNLYKSIKAFGLGGQEAYYEYCPMAFNNTGGYWLSDQEEIRNPYFGKKMLTCGEVKEKLK